MGKPQTGEPLLLRLAAPQEDPSPCPIPASLAMFMPSRAWIAVEKYGPKRGREVSGRAVRKEPAPGPVPERKWVLAERGSSEER